MSKHDNSDRRNLSERGQSKRVGTSVLVAAASLLGTSLGVSAATPPGAQDLAGQNAVETRSVEHKSLLAGNNVAVQPVHVSPKLPQVNAKVTTTNQLKINQLKINNKKSIQDQSIQDQSIQDQSIQDQSIQDQSTQEHSGQE